MSISCGIFVLTLAGLTWCQEVQGNPANISDISWTNGVCSGQYLGEIDSQMVPDGFGTFQCSSYNYSGDWRQGLRHGRGVQVFSNGDTYIGQWRRDQRHGEGQLLWRTGRRYSGQMEAGRMHGQGEMTWPSGDVYVGHWEADSRQGFGLYIYSSGTRVSTLTTRRRVMASFGGLLVQMPGISISATSRMTRDMEMDLIISPMETSSPELGGAAGSMGQDTRHSPMETCWMVPGRMEEDTESSSSPSPTEPDTRQSTTLAQDREAGTRLNQFLIIQNILSTEIIRESSKFSF